MTARLKPRNGQGRATNQEMIEFWVAHAGQRDVEMPTGRGSVYIGGKDGDTIYSYGSHFPLARVMPRRGTRRGWFLINGDRWSSSGWGGHWGQTGGQQAEIRRLIRHTGLDFMILPDSCLRLASIDDSTIRPVNVQDDREETVTHTGPRLPGWMSVPDVDGNPAERHGARQLPDGRWTWTTTEHVLGESLFTAEYDEWDRDAHRNRRHRALFLSAFDQQEPGLSYFLCQLPGWSRARTVAAAFQDLKPELVRNAEAAGREVIRQGDIFAVAALYGTRELARWTTVQRARGGGMSYILGTNHKATEVRVENPAAPEPYSAAGDAVFARGFLWHDPPNRRPDHVRRQLGDRRGWWRLVKNTVPVDRRGNSRAWSVEGNRGRVD